jgi:hypothetical protein
MYIVVQWCKRLNSRRDDECRFIVILKLDAFGKNTNSALSLSLTHMQMITISTVSSSHEKSIHNLSMRSFFPISKVLWVQRIPQHSLLAVPLFSD